MAALILFLASLALIAGLASAAEVAVFALSNQTVEELAARGGLRARRLATLRARPLRLLTTVWAVRIGATAGSAMVAWEIARRAFGASLTVALAAAAGTIFVLMIVQLLFRAFAIRPAQRLALNAAVPLWVLSLPMLVAAGPLEALVRALAPGAAEALPRVTDREIRDLVGNGNGEPEIEEHERRLIQRAFLLDQTTAYDAMTPRVDIFAWPETRSLAEIAPKLRAVRFSRVPLYIESIDRITGILYMRQAYQALISGQHDMELRALAREPMLVPRTLTLDKLLLDFQSRRSHMGIVIDEYGGTDGLITLEDVLEELVGEIVDETDIAEDPIVRLGRNEVMVDGGADLREINHFFNSAFPQLEHRSLNGYLLDVLGRVPETGEKIVREGVLIEVMDATDTQVVRARLAWAPRPEDRSTRMEHDSSEAAGMAEPQVSDRPATRERTPFDRGTWDREPKG